MTDRARAWTIVILLAAALAVVVVARQGQRAAVRDAATFAAPMSSFGATEDLRPAGESTGRPRLVDLGAKQCIPCRLMAPILDELRHEHAGAMDVVFIDVWQNPDAATAYNIEAIPTQIFLDGTGRELYRHQGFMAKPDILAMWTQLGYNLGSTRSTPVR